MCIKNLIQLLDIFEERTKKMEQNIDSKLSCFAEEAVKVLGERESQTQEGSKNTKLQKLQQLFLLIGLLSLLVLVIMIVVMK